MNTLKFRFRTNKLLYRVIMNNIKDFSWRYDAKLEIFEDNGLLFNSCEGKVECNSEEECNMLQDYFNKLSQD